MLQFLSNHLVCLQNAFEKTYPESRSPKGSCHFLCWLEVYILQNNIMPGRELPTSWQECNRPPESSLLSLMSSSQGLLAGPPAISWTALQMPDGRGWILIHIMMLRLMPRILSLAFYRNTRLYVSVHRPAFISSLLLQTAGDSIFDPSPIYLRSHNCSFLLHQKIYPYK